MILSSITYTILIFFSALTPLPSIPLIILNYQKNGIFFGMFTTIIAGSMASIVHFKLSSKGELILKKRFKKLFRKADKYKKYFKNLNIRELFFIQLSGIIPAPVISISSGLNQIKFNKFIISTLLSSIFGQIVYIIATNQINIFEKYLIRIGITKIQTLYFSVSIGCLIAFTLSIILRTISKNFLMDYKR